MSFRTSYVQPTIPTNGYSFVAAANLYKNYGGLSVYVKHKLSKKPGITVKEESLNHAWYICPDREIIVVFNSRDSNAFIPYGESIDEVYDFSTFNDLFCKSLGINYIMTNFAHSKESKLPRISLRTDPDTRIQVLSDSGGLQLMRSDDYLIHPIDLITFYNDNADSGMVLDVPYHHENMKVCVALAKLQKKNTDILLKYSKGIELINIFHGKTEKEREKFKEITQDDRVQRVAISGTHIQTPVTACHTVMSVVTDPFYYKQYHLLGIYKLHLIPLFVKMANMESISCHITSDSTSHIQGAINRHYYTQFDVTFGMKRLPIGDRDSYRSQYRNLPCQCPICHVIKYMDILAVGHGRTSHRLLSLHNAHEMSRYANSLQDVCRNYPKKYNSIVSGQLRNSALLTNVKHALQYIDTIESSGFSKANAKYRNMLDCSLGNPGAPKGTMFSAHNSEQSNYDLKTKKAIHYLDVMNKQIETRN